MAWSSDVSERETSLIARTSRLCCQVGYIIKPMTRAINPMMSRIQPQTRAALLSLRISWPGIKRTFPPTCILSCSDVCATPQPLLDPESRHAIKCLLDTSDGCGRPFGVALETHVASKWPWIRGDLGAARVRCPSAGQVLNPGYFRKRTRPTGH